MTEKGIEQELEECVEYAYGFFVCILLGTFIVTSPIVIGMKLKVFAQVSIRVDDGSRADSAPFNNGHTKSVDTEHPGGY